MSPSKSSNDTQMVVLPNHKKSFLGKRKLKKSKNNGISLDVGDYSSSENEKIIAPQEATEDVNRSFQSISTPSKKVTFNDTVDSLFINQNFELRGKVKLNGIPPKSILKYTNVPAKKVKLNGIPPKSVLKCTNVPAYKMKNSKCKKTRRPMKQVLAKVEPAKSLRRSKAFTYLENWKNDRNTWKFEKVVQTWLLKNMFDNSTLPEDKFNVLLEYMEEMRGAAVLLAVKLSENVVRNSEQNSQNGENEESLESSYYRAKLVLQLLRK